MIIVFVFNTIGYRFYYYFSQKVSDQQSISALDKNKFDESELITLKIPILNAYQNESEFERIDGIVTFKGIIYRYVKRKISDGNLVLLCLPDHNRIKMEIQKSSVTALSVELQNTGSKHTDKKFLVENVQQEYLQPLENKRFINFNIISKAFTPYSEFLLSYTAGVIPQPPELI